MILEEPIKGVPLVKNYLDGEWVKSKIELDHKLDNSASVDQSFVIRIPTTLTTYTFSPRLTRVASTTLPKLTSHVLINHPSLFPASCPQPISP
jgi:hypothetical protein